MVKNFNELMNKSLTLQKDVSSKDTYDGLLSTAALTKLMLDTAWALLDKELHDGVTSVCSMVQVNHEEPTVAGETVTVEATVKKVEENKIFIALKAVDETGVISHGLNERLIVDRVNLKKLAEQRSAVLKTIL
ncbi:MAG: hotdog domain-containing protein [Spirochaetales bacterium]|nr:hotdog domain-containing protein [Spirochaetales bacterium]